MPKKNFVVAWVRAFFGRDNEGGALVEMAISLPIMLLIMTGIFSFSVALYQKLQLAEAVGNAGRLLAVDRGANDPCQDATNAIYAAAPGLTQSSITLTYNLYNPNFPSGGTTAIGASGALGKSCNTPGGNIYMGAGGTAEIQAQYSGCMLNIVNVWGKNMTGACTLSAQVTEVVQ
ncbi:MAG: TadE/TadG family type IV pilus assembly protein [Terracidiphilus sp.]